jgi:hypothetical protein
MSWYKVTQPDLYPAPPRDTVWKLVESVVIPNSDIQLIPDPVPEKKILPAIDSRYPAFAGQQSDARFGTDYRPQCAKNLPTGYQFASKQWMIHNADDIINENRIRMAQTTGSALRPAKYPLPPFENVVECTPFICETRNLADNSPRKGQIGIYRDGDPTPSLFGTFEVDPRLSLRESNVKNIELTQKYEGGRNTPRGGQSYLRGSG